MKTSFSVLSWNVHNLINEVHAARIVDHIREVNPDIFGLAEVVREPAYRLVATQFPEHNFYMTYGKQSQELLIGVRRNIKAFFSQKTEF